MCTIADAGARADLPTLITVEHSDALAPAIRQWNFVSDRTPSLIYEQDSGLTLTIVN